MTRLLRALRFFSYGLAGLLFLLLVATAAERVVWRGKVLPGVDLIGASVEGKSADTVDDLVARSATRLERETLTATAGSHTLTLDPRSIDLRIDVDATAEALESAGRSGNPVDQLLGTVLRMARSDEVPWKISYDQEALRDVLEDWEADVASSATDGTLRFQGMRVIPVEPRAGRALDRPAADRVVVDALRSGRRDGVALPVVQKTPEITSAEVAAAAEKARALLTTSVTVTFDDLTVRLSPRQIAGFLEPMPTDGKLEIGTDDEDLKEALGKDVAKLEGPPEDARFEVSGTQVEIVAHTIGKTIDLDHLEAAIVDGEPVIEGRFEEEEPETTTEDLEALGVEELVSSFTTHHPAGQPRVQNIHKAADVVNDTIVRPDHVFSLNDTLGRRTLENGYVVAPVIYGGEYTEDVGGGISQFATTFFNAVFFGGYPLVEFQAHTFYISRYPMGREATVSFPSPDLSFKNDTDHAIWVRTSVTATSVTVNFYSTKLRSVDAEGPVVLDTFDIPEEFEPDGSIERGQRVVRESGSEGRLVRVTRVINDLEGNELSRKTFTTRYRPETRLVAVHPCDLPDDHDAKPPEEECKEEEEEPEEPPPDETTTTTSPDAGAP